MSTLTIRNIDADIKDKLRLAAAAHGRSMEKEVHTILRSVLPVTVLDTNVVLALMRPAPNQAMLAWVDGQSDRDLWLCSVGVSALLYGLARLPPGARRAQLTQAFEAMLAEDFASRVMAFDLPAAVVYADLVARREREGQPVALADAQIAATCLAHSAQLATRHVRHFEGLGLAWVNPWLA